MVFAGKGGFLCVDSFLLTLRAFYALRVFTRCLSLDASVYTLRGAGVLGLLAWDWGLARKRLMRSPWRGPPAGPLGASGLGMGMGMGQ